MTIHRQRFSNTRSRGNEQTRKSIASQWLAKNTFPWQRIIHELLEMVIYIRFAWNVVQFGRSSFERDFSVQLWSTNQRTTEAEEVTDS
jgi:hypothetical protein